MVLSKLLTGVELQRRISIPNPAKEIQIVPLKVASKLLCERESYTMSLVCRLCQLMAVAPVLLCKLTLALR